MKQSKEKLAESLDSAALHARAVPMISITDPIDLDQSYDIQKLSIDRRLDRGEILTGYKLGFTSKAKMEQMGVHSVIWGRLTDAMHIEQGATIQLNKFIHPRAEPEIAFRISKKIDAVLTLDNVNEYFDGVAAAIEIIDSRYENFKFSLEDVIADNCSSSAYVLGKWWAPDTAVSNLSIALNINGDPVKTGNSDAILGNPIESLIEMSKMVVKYNVPVEPGMILLAGAATSAEYIKTGDQIKATFDTLGEVSVKVQ